MGVFFKETTNTPTPALFFLLLDAVVVPLSAFSMLGAAAAVSIILHAVVPPMTYTRPDCMTPSASKRHPREAGTTLEGTYSRLLSNSKDICDRTGRRIFSVLERCAEWMDEGHKKCLILWHRIQDWADIILHFVRDNGLEDSVMRGNAVRN